MQEPPLRIPERNAKHLMPFVPTIHRQKQSLFRIDSAPADSRTLLSVETSKNRQFPDHLVGQRIP